MFQQIKQGNIQKIVLCLIGILLVVGCVGCGTGEDVPEQTPVVPTLGPAKTASSTVIPTLIPTATPTATPESTPEPTPETTSVPKVLAFTKTTDVAPEPGTTQAPNPGEGTEPKKLFDENYYAVLPGDAAHYNVYDCYGNWVGQFQNPNTSYSNITGLYAKDSIAYGYNFATLYEIGQERKDSTGFVVNVGEQYYWTYDYRNGQISIYDRKDQLFYQTKAFPEDEESYGFAPAGVLETKNGLLVFACDAWKEGSPNMIDPVLVAWDGSVTKLRLGENQRLMGTLGEKYFVVRVVDGDWWDGQYAICDTNGKVVASDVIPIIRSGWGIGMEDFIAEAMTFTSDKYISGGKVYGADLQLLDVALPEDFSGGSGSHYTDGLFYIERGCYTINGISYEADYAGTFLYGRQEDTLYLMIDGKQYTFTCNPKANASLRAHSAGSNLVALSDDDYDYLIRLSDGACLEILEGGYFWVAETFAVGIQWLEDGRGLYSIYDLNGQVHYQTTSAELQFTECGLLVIERGPYIGIADIDGNYLLKTLVPSLAGDHVPQEEVYW